MYDKLINSDQLTQVIQKVDIVLHSKLESQTVNSLDSVPELAFLTGVNINGIVQTATNGIVNLPAYPITLPASDVSAWAKAATKPTYTLDEVSDGDTRKLSDYLPVNAGDFKTKLKENQEFTSRQTADGTLDWNPSAEVIKRIKGKTLVWNQLLSNGNFINKTDWHIQRCAFGVSNNIATITVNSGETNGLIYVAMTLTADHKYYIGCSIKASGANMSRFYVGSSTLYLSYYTQSADWERYSAICTIPEQAVPFVIRNYDNSNPLLARDACVIDLTLMFGEGNEPETVEEFESMFPLPYYEYNTGTLISNSAEGLETIGFNLWDGEFSQTNALLTNNGVVTTSGSEASSYNISSYIPVNVGKAYCLSNLSGNSPSACFYDADKTFISGEKYGNYKNLIITAPSNAAYLRLSISQELANETCVSISSSRDGTYEPYHKSTLPLSLNSFKVKDSNGNITTITGGLKSAGTVYDEIVGNKYIQRIGSVDLGTLSWVYQDENNRWKATYLGINAAASSANAFNGVSNKHQVVSITAISTSASQQGLAYSSDSLYCRTSSSTAPDGILYYELTTPVEYELINPLVFTTSIDALGTESISPANTSTPYTTPFIADIQYGAKSGDLADDIHTLIKKNSSTLTIGSTTITETQLQSLLSTLN